MIRKPRDKASVSILGFGAAACAACCAGPVLGFLAAAGLLTAGGVALFGIAGLLVVIPAAVWFRRRRATTNTCATPSETVPVQFLPGTPSQPLRHPVHPNRVRVGL